MNDLEKELHIAPDLNGRAEHQQATVERALHAFYEQKSRKRAFVPFIASFLGTAAAILIVAVVFLLDKDQTKMSEKEPLSREMIVQAYVDLRSAFPDGLAAVAFVDGEIQIFPGLVKSQSFEPTYVEMMIGSSELKIVAAPGVSLPVTVNDSTVLIELMPDAAGRPTVLGEDFYWSTQAKFMPSTREVLKAEQMELFL